jgi:hypothetical protein
MKVYIVHETVYPDHYTLGVFSTKEKALECALEVAEYAELTLVEDCDDCFENEEGDRVVEIEEVEVDA